MAGPYFGSFGARGHQPTSFGPRDTRGSWRLARKMPARVAHKLPGQCDASGREGGEGDSTRSGKRGAAVGDAGCGVRACAGGAAAGPGACLRVRKFRLLSTPKCLETSKQGRS